MIIQNKWNATWHIDDDEHNQEGTEVEVTEYPVYDDNWNYAGSTSKVRDGNGRIIAIIDFNEEGKGQIRYCPHCEEYGFEHRLGVKIKKHGELPPPDDDKFVSCHQCGNTFPLHETHPETKLKVATRTTDNPFEDESIFLSIDSRATERKKGMKRRSKRSELGEDEDPEIQAAIDKGHQVKILYDSSN